MGQKWDKFCLLLWKNWKLQIRHPVRTAAEFLTPVLFASLLVVIRSVSYYVSDNVNGTSYEPFQADIKEEFKNLSLAWSPYNLILNEIVTDAVYRLGLRGNVPYMNSTSLLSSLQINSENILAAVQFDDLLYGDVSIPEKLEITIRYPSETRTYGLNESWQTDHIFPVSQSAGPRGYGARGGPPYYAYEGFLAVQQELSYSLISYLKRSIDNSAFNKPNLLIQRYPYPRWVEDDSLSVMEVLAGLIIMISFIFTCITIVRNITIEKEKLLKETMKIMGLPGWLHWTAWFVKEFITLLIVAILVIILIKVKWIPGKDFSVFTATDPTVLFALFLPFICSLITFAFLISVFFSKARVATGVAGFVWFLSYTPYTIALANGLSYNAKMFSCLLSNTAFALGLQSVIKFEENNEGLQWNNFWSPDSMEDGLVVGHIFLMLIFDTFLYLLLALYIDAVFPGKFGVPKKWYFPFTASYWCGKSNDPIKINMEPETHQNDFIEEDPQNLRAGIRIKNLTKIYSGNKKAVNDLSLNLYEGQITVLLGHNGAGKTTAMSMLTGIFPPTHGTAIIDGHDIRTDMDEVRNSLGICTQNNVLYDELTVYDHFYFFGRLKGVKKDKINSEIEEHLKLLELTDKRDAQASTLSGGMKRKLCVGIALCGNSKIVMLDEPSSGVDPSARRLLWDLLQKQKEGRIILLTTHFMDEADLLGDRIAIMADGELQCCGSSFFLKKKYGTGYHLIIDKTNDCKVVEITRILQKYIPDITVESNAGTELSYILDEKKSHVFESLLADLERNSTSLGIRSYGISLSTLEEVFMKAGAHVNPESNKDSNRKIVNKRSRETMVDVNVKNQNYLKGPALLWNQFLAMFIKRVLSTYRSWLVVLIQILIPIGFLIVSITISRSGNKRTDSPSLKITLDSYDDPLTLVSGTTANDYYKSYTNLINSLNHRYIDYGEVDLAEIILNQTIADTPSFRKHGIVSASFEGGNNITAWFSNLPYHAAPLTLNLVLNSILQQELGTKYSIEIINHPLPYKVDTKLEEVDSFGVSGFLIPFNLGFSMIMVSSFFIMFYIRERVTKAKHLQFVSGVNIYVFWGASLLNDILFFVTITDCTLIALVSFQEDGFSTLQDINHLFSLFMCFCWAFLPLTYLVSLLCDTPTSGFTRMTIINLIGGTGFFLLTKILTMLDIDIGIIRGIFLIIPHFAFIDGISNMSTKHQSNSLCKKFISDCLNSNESHISCEEYVCDNQPKCCGLSDNYYELNIPGIGLNVLISLLVGTVWIILLLLIEHRVFHNCKCILCKTLQRNQNYTATNIIPEEDSDVLLEKQKIRNADVETLKKSCIALRDVTKYYGKTLAVNNICLTVDRYECFGLLGVNGAGKTTTFKIMTGDLEMSSGEAWINGLSVKKNMNEIYKHIGYCPQFDALLDDLTGRETMQMFCIIRGISYRESKVIVDQLARDFDFIQHVDKRVREYSGGNKRKLSTAVALIGDPLVIYLDEPSTDANPVRPEHFLFLIIGMDPVTKRRLWNVLSRVRDQGKCLVLTSHSMEECEALCTRLAIMINGAFKCMGSIQHLKNKFSEGYSLQVKIRKTSNNDWIQFQNDINSVKSFIETNFPGALLLEDHFELLNYNIKSKSLPWSAMFGIMERGRATLNIEDYSLGQSNLEQVFLSFTKHQSA